MWLELFLPQYIRAREFLCRLGLKLFFCSFYEVDVLHPEVPEQAIY